MPLTEPLWCSTTRVESPSGLNCKIAATSFVTTYPGILFFVQVGWAIRRFETMKGGSLSDTLPLRDTKPSLEVLP
jgi:hypothetical protein